MHCRIILQFEIWKIELSNTNTSNSLCRRINHPPAAAYSSTYRASRSLDRVWRMRKQRRERASQRARGCSWPILNAPRLPTFSRSILFTRAYRSCPTSIHVLVAEPRTGRGKDKLDLVRPSGLTDDLPWISFNTHTHTRTNTGTSKHTHTGRSRLDAYAEYETTFPWIVCAGPTYVVVLVNRRKTTMVCT